MAGQTGKKQRSNHKLNPGKTIWLLIVLTWLACQGSPGNLKSEQNLLRGIALGKQLNKPIFIHFTCHGCMGYNEFYNDLIQSREILNTLNQEFITIELYVDDQKNILPNDTLNIDQIGLSAAGKASIKNARTIGNINAIIEEDWFKKNTQPLYVIIDADRNVLVEPFEYTRKNSNYFLKKLKAGLREFEQVRPYR